MGDEITIPPAILTLLETFLIDEGPAILSEIEALLKQIDSTHRLRATRLLATREGLKAFLATLAAPAPAAPPTPTAPPAG